MAEILVTPRASKVWDDGDCLCAFNRRRILCEHAQNICNLKRAKRNQSGLVLLTELAFDFFESTYQYKFERVSANEIKRTTLADNSEEVFSDKPNAKGEQMDVRLFIARRKQGGPNHYLFGEDGSEVWFGGESDFSMPKIRKAWDRIENKSPHRRNQKRRRLWPFGRQEIRSYIAIRHEEMTDAEVEDMIAPEYEYDDNGDSIWVRELPNGKKRRRKGTGDDPPNDHPDWQPVVKKERNTNIDWRALLGDLGVTEAQVLDSHTPIGVDVEGSGEIWHESKDQPDKPKAKAKRKKGRQRP